MAIEIVVLVCVDLIKSFVSQHSNPGHIFTLQDFRKVSFNLLVIVLLESGVLNLLAEGLKEVPAMLLCNCDGSQIQLGYLVG
jgi:hypothetical protein